MPEGQRVFITGGASGLGRALAERYVDDGARVLIGDVDAARMQEAVGTLGASAHGLACDVTKVDDLEAAAAWMRDTWGGVDVVVNNAGVAAGGSIDATPMDDWSWIVDINFLGVVRGCRSFVPLLKEQGHGHVVNVASMAGLINPPHMAAYNTTKAAVVSLSETLRTELHPHGIHVSVVCPAFFRTNLLERFRGTGADVQRTTRRLVTRAKLGAPEVAERIHRGIDQKEFLILTHGEGRQAWFAKRFLPSDLFARIVVKKAARAMEDRGGSGDA